MGSPENNKGVPNVAALQNHRVYHIGYYDRVHQRKMSPNPYPELAGKGRVRYLGGPLVGGEMYAAIIKRNGNIAKMPIIIVGRPDQFFGSTANEWERKR